MGCVYILGYLHWQGYQHLAVFCVRTQEVCFVDCTLSRPLEPRSQTLIPRSHGPSFPNSHTQITWSLIPKLSYPDHMEPHSQTLVPKLSYPDHMEPHSQTLIPRSHGASFPDSHTQTLIPRPHEALFPNSH